MSDLILLPLQVPTLPEGFCSSLGADWVQQLMNEFGKSVAVLNSGSGAGTIILNQEAVPGVDQRGFLWFRPSQGIIFRWDSGAWIAPNRTVASGEERRLYEGVPANIWSYDGGDGSDPSIVAPNTNVGAMWEVDTNYAGRSPMGPGAIPTSFPAKNLSLSENFGEGAHTQTQDELATHTHPPSDNFEAFIGYVKAGQASNFEILGGTETAKMLATGATGGNVAANIVHPSRGIYTIKRTQRANYVAS